jgi:hypothetical protein
MEIWKTIPGYEGRLEASSLGRVRTVTRQQWCKTHWRTYRGRTLRPGAYDRFGHLSVAVRRGKSVSVHSLIALTFIGPRPEGLDIAHLNGDGGDNRPENLAYVTRTRNNEHVTLHDRRLLSAEQASNLKAALRKPLMYGDQRRLAAEHGVKEALVSAIKHGRLYGHIE